MKNYILYGAASIGNLAKGALETCGLHVAGYIDRRAFEIKKYNGLPVWGLDEVPAEYLGGDTAVYVAVKNVFDHESIARSLRERGFCNLIYKPYQVLLGFGSKEELKVAEIYDQLFAGSIKGESIELPQIRQEETLHDFAVIQSEKEQITAYLPTELVFTNHYVDTPMEKWGDVCIPAFFTHIEFFRFCAGVLDAKPYDYLQEYCVFTAQLQKNIAPTDLWKANVIENRTQIYEQMRLAMDLDPVFFVRNAACAAWNGEKNYFNLTSGKHRCTFQAAMGKKYMPLKVAKNDYRQFLNRLEAEKTMQELTSRRAKLWIPHPFFYRGMHDRDKGEWVLALWFARHYAKNLYKAYGKICFDRLKVVDFTDDYGYFARFCRRLGCHVNRQVQPDGLEMQLNRLFGAQGIVYGGTVRMTGVHTVIILEAAGRKEPDGREKDFLQEAGSWILKDASKEFKHTFAQEHSLQTVLAINQRYENGSLLYSYLLEKRKETEHEKPDV